ncbi:MAG: hypothetical protein K2Z81_28815, partial [Cyanobacteria bacterium]|nr:hypothetical protein [Cyanobacteriota bacterium]
DPKDDEVLGVQNEINKMAGEMAMDRIKLLLDIRKVLSAEQKQKLVDLLTQQGPPPGSGGSGGGQQ